MAGYRQREIVYPVNFVFEEQVRPLDQVIKEVCSRVRQDWKVYAKKFKVFYALNLFLLVLSRDDDEEEQEEEDQEEEEKGTVSPKVTSVVFVERTAIEALSIDQVCDALEGSVHNLIGGYYGDQAKKRPSAQYLLKLVWLATKVAYGNPLG